jgi:hypothetical protein
MLRRFRGGVTVCVLLSAAAVSCTSGRDESTGERPVEAVVADTMLAEGAGPGDSVHEDGATDAAGHWTAGDTFVDGQVSGSALLRGVRSARHDGFDRIVFEFESASPGYRISYIDRPVRQCGSGEVVPLAGDAWLSMRFEPADAHTAEGAPTIMERSRSPALPNVIELKLICDFEAQVEWVAGVHMPMEYRVLTLHDPTRVVVDIRHPAIRHKPSEGGE